MMIEMPNSPCRRCISSRICAWMVTSSAVVGSSATSNDGLHDSAIAIIARWRMPPESWCGYSHRTPLGIGDAHLAQHLHRPRARLARRLLLVELDRLHDLVADGVHRVQAGHRLLEDHRDLAAADAPVGTAVRVHLRQVHLAVVLAAEPQAAADGGGGGRHQPHDAERGHGLAAAALADQPQGAVAPHRQVDAVHRAHGAAVGMKPGLQVADLEQWSVSAGRRRNGSGRAVRRPVGSSHCGQAATPGPRCRWRR